MLAKWVLIISGIDGWVLLDRALETGGIVTSMPMVMALAAIGVRRLIETSKGRRLGWSGTCWDDSL
jgi:hypothetical protein